MIHYFAKISARVRCQFCNERKLVANAGEIDCSEEHLDGLETQVADAINDQLDEDGWRERAYCPDCLTTHGAQINAIEAADDDREDER